MKKIFSIILVGTLLLSGVTVLASNLDKAITDDRINLKETILENDELLNSFNVNSEVLEELLDEYIDILENRPEELAYKDINTRGISNEMKMLILDARSKVIQTKSWTVNGFLKMKNEDGELVALPEFEDVFPEWDLEEIDNYLKYVLDNGEDDYIVKSSYDFDGEAYVPYVRDKYYGNEFYEFTPDRDDFEAWAEYIPGETYNIGFRNTYTDESYGVATRIKAGRRYSLFAKPIPRSERDHIFSVRCSTYDEDGTGTGYFRV